MIRKLRIKFIAISMTSTIIVLFLILGSINLLNYREMSHNADTILDFLKENDGELPENLYKSQHKKTNGISPETSFESRYFSVFLSNNRQRCEAMKKQRSNMHKKSIEVTRTVDSFQNTDI